MAPRAPGTAAAALMAALADGQTRTIGELSVAVGLNRRQISDAAAKLARRGLVERSQGGCYRLTDSGIGAHREGRTITSGPIGPTGARRLPRDTFRARAWAAMWVRKVFTIGEIVADAGRGDPEAERDNARRYITALKAAGFVAEMPRRKAGTAVTSNGFKEFRLTRRTGPRAPVHSEVRRAIHDPNTGEDVSCARC